MESDPKVGPQTQNVSFSPQWLSHIPSRFSSVAFIDSIPPATSFNFVLINLNIHFPSSPKSPSYYMSQWVDRPGRGVGMFKFSFPLFFSSPHGGCYPFPNPHHAVPPTAYSFVDCWWKIGPALRLKFNSYISSKLSIFQQVLFSQPTTP
jgi:hypothetical protein